MFYVFSQRSINCRMLISTAMNASVVTASVLNASVVGTSEMDASGARLLVVDDEIALRDMLERGLRRAGFRARGVADGKSALDVVRRWDPELIILDVMLPGLDGFALLPSLRRLTEVPIIMLSAKTETDEKIRGLLCGADDYVAKPFELRELIVRITTALRRPRLEHREMLTYVDLRVDLVRRVAARGTRRIDLSTREFDLLIALLQIPEHAFSRAELLDAVWGFDSDVFPNTLETYISLLRAKIDSGESTKLIKTIRGVGYALQAQPQ
jgi:DNA-binding response OmpR family regulator